MKIPYPKNKCISFGFAAVDYHAIIQLINKLDPHAFLQIEATDIFWDETFDENYEYF